MRDLRAALVDDAEAPRFIETIPHPGYRFVAEVRQDAIQEDVIPSIFRTSAVVWHSTPESRVKRFVLFDFVAPWPRGQS
jgi:DNA-binding winged helix-turn-helix (wHTH) protein